MMRVLIVNNGVNHPAKIVSLLGNALVDIVSSLDVCTIYPKADHDLIILSGSNTRPIPYFHDTLRPLLDWIKLQKQPLIGICYGAELIVEAYGGTLNHLGKENKVKGFFTYQVLPNPIISKTSLRVYEGHQWVVESVPEPLYPVISSPRGVLMFGHSTLPHIGTMFHPEKFPEETDGKLIFEEIKNYLRLPSI